MRDLVRLLCRRGLGLPLLSFVGASWRRLRSLLLLLALLSVQVFEFLLCAQLRSVLLFLLFSRLVLSLFGLSCVLLGLLDQQACPSLPLVEPLCAHDMIHLVAPLWHEVDLHLLEKLVDADFVPRLLGILLEPNGKVGETTGGRKMPSRLRRQTERRKN